MATMKKPSKMSGKPMMPPMPPMSPAGAGPTMPPGMKRGGKVKAKSKKK